MLRRRPLGGIHVAARECGRLEHPVADRARVGRSVAGLAARLGEVAAHQRRERECEAGAHETLLAALHTAAPEDRLALTVGVANTEWWLGRTPDARRRLHVALGELPAEPSPDRMTNALMPPAPASPVRAKTT